ncbi:MAG: protoporphyrinogen oxidase [Armatimonadetes bacterium]|nr:protoporphyrinogen oxidase [Armatimonadota bacterium]MBS1711101.1 protoporphyrinogen oxidase [Armatimonadota bacterium]MBX3108774.1 hypothetical protein [Fimbriimonadaceae bacterium]
MKPLLIVYATTEGQTRKIAFFAQDAVMSTGRPAEVFDAAHIPPDLDIDDFAGAILAGSLHQGKHQAALAHFARRNATALNALPTLFLSVSLSAVVDDESHRADCQDCIDTFLQETGLRPTECHAVAGALKYVQYDWVKRMIMRSISQHENRETDTSRDYEYTDWVGLKELVVRFVASIPS